MFFVYILQSQNDLEKIYVGVTTDLKQRLTEHNSGKSHHTDKYKPWVLKTYTAFPGKDIAYEFEKYLKSGNGRLFLKKRLL